MKKIIRENFVSNGLLDFDKINNKINNKDNSIYNGHGADTDIVKASVLALINALNKYIQNPNLDISKKRGVWIV